MAAHKARRLEERGACSPQDGHENPQGEEEKIRVAPGQALKPASTDIFQRLHASHAAKMEKLSLMKELADREEAEQLEELKRCTIRTCSSEEEAGKIYGRLYQEAELRRRRQAEREHEQLEATSAQISQLSSVKSQGAGPPRWEQLYNSAPIKEKRLGEERQRALEEEARWLAQNCIHRSSADVQPDKIFQRLYRDGQHREQRKEQLRSATAATEARQLVEGSVHASRNLSAADLEERTRRLYEDGLQRIERLEEARRQQQSLEYKAPVRSASSGPSRFELLYGDASRREEERKLWQEYQQKEELDMCQRNKSPRNHEATMKRSASARNCRTPRRHDAGDELEEAREAPLPGHSALVPAQSAARHVGGLTDVDKGSRCQCGACPADRVAMVAKSKPALTVPHAPNAQTASSVQGEAPGGQRRATTPRRAKTPPRATTLPRAITPPRSAQAQSQVEPAQVVAPPPKRTPTPRSHGQQGGPRSKTPPPDLAVSKAAPSRARTPVREAPKGSPGKMPERPRTPPQAHTLAERLPQKVASSPPQRKALSKSAAIRTGAWPK
ncbi:unnamed protein product [Effrenium voratum]|uniref:Uncharacterized protein n=1 Tax=Effrenium voratum TaxID=2562239 RepID=A0AA36MZQ2_9DINO|nr:unnamed protein product [Effrenium voratum]